MTQPKDKTIDELHKQVEGTRARLHQADEHLKEIGEGAQKIGLSITGATLEINALMKQLFLCAHHDLAEYEILHAQLTQHLNNIALIANTRFGRQAAPGAKKATETH
jgi:hypothetical protein